MKLLILEYVTAGGLGDPNESPLLEEADAMALSLARDFSELSSNTVSLLRHPNFRLPPPDPADLTGIVPSQAPQHPPTQEHKLGQGSVQIIASTGLASEWEQAFMAHEEVLIVAPETDSILLNWSVRADQTGIRRWGPRLEALSITSNKLQTAQHLETHFISHVPTYRLDTMIPWHSHNGTWVIKPIDGCGCEGVQRFTNAEHAQSAILSLPSPHRSQWVAQPWLAGQAASLTLLGSDEGVQLLSVNEQILNIAEDGFVQLQKVITGSIPLDRTDFEILAQSVHEAIPGLHGIYGIDLLIQDHQLTVVEINPRVTSAYPGLRAALGLNPATLWMQRLGLANQA